MVVLIVESVPPSLRGELSKWMLEPRAGVFVGTLSAAVRDLLWEKARREAGGGGCTMIFRTNNEQGFVIRTWGDTSREIVEWEGLFLVRRPNLQESASIHVGFEMPGDWSEYLHPEIWAKTARGVELAEGEGDYHPLCCHMIDTAMVALRLWQYVLPSPLRDQMRVRLGLQSDVEAGRWFAFFAGLHDVGKATPPFAKQWTEGWSVLVDEGYSNVTSSGSLPHYVLSTFLLEGLLEELGIPAQTAVPIAAMLGAHHGLLPGAVELEKADRFVGGGRWSESRKHLVRMLAYVTRINLDSPPQADLFKANDLQIVLAGLTTVADWIASNHDFFPYTGKTVTLPRYARLSRWRAWIALYKLGWFDQPREMLPRAFEDIFDHVVQPNNLQQAIIQIADKLNGPSLVLIEYPMGGGKTEAALYLSDRLSSLAGLRGAYFALPTMATSNQLFQRVAQYLQLRFGESGVNFQLVHGRADFNEDFAKLRRRALSRRHDNLGRVDTLEAQLSDVGETATEKVVAAEWFTYKKRGLLAPYGVGTIDQALLAVLQTKHFFVRLFGLCGKVVIVDEVHAYDTYMRSLLRHLLSWLAACGTSVVLLSATLPSRMRHELIEAYAVGRGSGHVVGQLTAPYPRIIWITDHESAAVHVKGAPMREVKLASFRWSEPSWKIELKRALEGGGCAAVILNTVGQAQRVYQELKGYFAADELMLFHARYPFDERMERERNVLEKFGRDSECRPYRVVVVATQVIEQSLDLDFDVMVTALAPIDLVVQRSGRLWRHRRPRPEGLNEPTLWLLMPDCDELGVPRFDGGTSRVYHAHVLLRSWVVLSKLSSIRIPDDLENIIEAVYSRTDPPQQLPEPLRQEWEATRAKLESEEKRDEMQAAKRYIPHVSSELWSMVMDELGEEEGDKHPALQALTRLGGPSVEVVCLLERNGCLYVPGARPQEIRLEKRPDLDEVRALLGRSLSISFDPGLARRILELEPPEAWAGSAYLRRSRLLTFDESGRCTTAELPLRLDPELGLVKVSGEEAWE